MKSTETKTFETYKEFLSFMQKVNQDDKWLPCKVTDLHIESYQTADIDVERLNNNISLSATDEHIAESMTSNGTGCVISIPVGEETQTYPVRDTAVKSLCDRARLSGQTVYNNLTLLNHGFDQPKIMRYVKDRLGLILLRDGMVSAIHSGNDYDYSVLPAADLLQILEVELDYHMPNSKFVKGSFSHSLTTASFCFPDQEKDFLKILNDALARNKKPLEETAMPVLYFETNDIAQCSVTLVPKIRLSHSSFIRIGAPVSLTHQHKHTVFEFSQCIEKLFSSFRDNMKKVAELADVKITYPKECFINLAKKLKLPVKESNTALEIFLTYADDTNTSALDIYYALWEIPALLKASESSSEKLIRVEENITRALFANFKSVDKMIA